MIGKVFEGVFPGVISAIIGALLGWLISRRKQRAEVTHIDLQNITAAISIWEITGKQLAAQVKELKAECVALTEEVEQLRRENRELKTELTKLEKTIQGNSN